LARPVPWLRILAEGVAIVVSILLAFGIQAWWEAGQQRAEAYTLLAALRVELVDARAEFVQADETLARGMVVIGDLLGVLSSTQPGSIPADSVDRLSLVFGPSRVFQPPQAALNDLTRAGGITLVESHEVRREIAAYEQALARDQADQSALEELFLTQIAPYRYEYGVMNQGAMDLPDRPFRADPNAFLGNRQYANLVLARIQRMYDVQQAHRFVVARIDSLLPLLPDG
jgi:hypothetical protein